MVHQQEAAKKAVAAGKPPPPPPGSAVLEGLKKQIGTLSEENKLLVNNLKSSHNWINQLTDEKREINRQLAVKNVQYAELFNGIKADQQEHRLIKEVLRQCHDWVDEIERKIIEWMNELGVPRSQSHGDLLPHDLANLNTKIKDLKRVLDLPIVDAQRPRTPQNVQPIPSANDPVLVQQAQAVVGWGKKKKKKKQKKKSRRRRGKKSGRIQSRRRDKVSFSGT